MFKMDEFIQTSKYERKLCETPKRQKKRTDLFSVFISFFIDYLNL